MFVERPAMTLRVRVYLLSRYINRVIFSANDDKKQLTIAFDSLTMMQDHFDLEKNQVHIIICLVSDRNNREFLYRES